MNLEKDIEELRESLLDKFPRWFLQYHSYIYENYLYMNGLRGSFKVVIDSNGFIKVKNDENDTLIDFELFVSCLTNTQLIDFSRWINEMICGARSRREEIKRMVSQLDEMPNSARTRRIMTEKTARLPIYHQELHEPVEPMPMAVANYR
jgi:hypothetical protein